MDPTFLTVDDVLESYRQQIERYGGSHGSRDQGLLESALAQPEATFGGQYLHAELYEMAAAYLFHLVNNHPFVDGNKRIGLDAALLFMEINNAPVVVTSEELVSLVLQTAQGQCAKPEIAAFFLQRVLPQA
jgi:death-on-curing protein